MTPKEKAEELFLNMYTVELWTGNHLDKEAAKQCVLIAVDEILKLEYWSFMEMGGAQEEQYWQEVKNEIELL